MKNKKEKDVKTVQDLKELLEKKTKCQHEFEENLTAILPHKKCKLCGEVYYLDFERDSDGNNLLT